MRDPYILSSAVVLAVALVSIVIWIARSGYRGARDGTWHLYEPFKMRRYVNGRWEYRDSDKSEREDFLSAEIW